MDDTKLRLKISQRVNAVMNQIDKALKKKHGGDLEFYGILVASKTNPWMLEDVIIPKQIVSSAQVDIPKDGMQSPYEKLFEDCIANNREYIPIGTIHSHNHMGTFFSHGDNEDLDNYACFNLNEGLPFVDIVWSNMDNKYKVRVRLKVGKGEAKQIFTIDDCECFLIPDRYTQVLLSKFKEILGEEYSVDEQLFVRSIAPSINTEDALSKIEKEKYSYNSGWGKKWKSDDRNWEKTGKVAATGTIISKTGNVKLEIKPYDQEHKLLVMTVTGKDPDVDNFVAMVEDELGQWYDCRTNSYLGEVRTNELACESKKRYKKMSFKIESIHRRFQIDYNEAKAGHHQSKIEEVVEDKVDQMTQEEYESAMYNGEYVEDPKDMSYLG